MFIVHYSRTFISQNSIHHRGHREHRAGEEFKRRRKGEEERKARGERRRAKRRRNGEKMTKRKYGKTRFTAGPLQHRGIPCERMNIVVVLRDLCDLCGEILVVG
jgi:hypothetical protein